MPKGKETATYKFLIRIINKLHLKKVRKINHFGRLDNLNNKKKSLNQTRSQDKEY